MSSFHQPPSHCCRETLDLLASQPPPNKRKGVMSRSLDSDLKGTYSDLEEAHLGQEKAQSGMKMTQTGLGNAHLSFDKAHLGLEGASFRQRRPPPGPGIVGTVGTVGTVGKARPGMLQSDQRRRRRPQRCPHVKMGILVTTLAYLALTGLPTVTGLDAGKALFILYEEVV